MLRHRWPAVIGFILVTVAFVFGFASNYRFRPRVAQLSNSLPVFDSDLVPMALDLSENGVDNLVFVMDHTCTYCAKNAPAWRILAREAVGSTRTRIALLSYSQPADTEAFKSAHHLTGIETFYLDADGVGQLGVRSVPATVLVSKMGGAPTGRFWDGVLSDSDIASILDEISAVPR